MKVLYKLRNEKKEALDNAQALVNTVEEENRDMTADEQIEYDELLASVDSLTTRIKRMEDIEEKMKESSALVVDDDADIAVGEPNILKDPKRGFKDMGDFALSVANAANPTQVTDERLTIMGAVSGHSMGTGADGGHLTPPAYSQKIYDGVMGASESLLGVTDNYTVGPNSDSLIFPAVNETSRVDGSRWGGVRGYWVAEGDQITSSKATTRQVTVAPYELAVLIYTTNKLLKNSTALGQFITRAAIDEISFLTGNSIIDGDGSSKPTGILQSACVVEVAEEGSQGNTTIVAANINNMWERIPARCWNTAVWFMNQDCLGQLDGVNIPTTDVAGTVTAAGFSSRIYNPEKFTLKGRPIVPLEYCKSCGTVGDIILADPKSYVVGLRGGVETDFSIHLRFDYNESVFRFVFEVDGKPWLSSAITPLNGSNTLSPFVTLATRGS